jgi:hypothetical protein
MFANIAPIIFGGDERRRERSVGRNDRLTPIRPGNAWDPKGQP